MTALYSRATSRLLRESVQAIARPLPQAIAGGGQAVHELRVACRRLRVTLSLLARKPDGRRAQRVRRALRLLTCAAGPARDLDVMLAEWAERVRATTKPAPELRTLLRHLQQAQRLGRRALTEKLLDLDIARLRRDLRALLERADAGAAVGLQRIHRRTERLVAMLESSLVTLGDSLIMDELHAVRMGVRRLRYVMEVRDVLLRLDGELPRRLRDQQRQLGRVHDVWILASWLGRQAERAGARGQAGLAAEATAQREHFEAQARAAHQAWLASEPRALFARLRHR